MSALLAMVDESIHLYSKPSRLPVDQVAPQHAEIHSDLERWGAWNRERYSPRTCGSAEGRYIRTRAQDQSTDYPRLPVWQPPNPRNREVDRAILRCAFRHQEILRRHYVDRLAPAHICKLMALHFRHFGPLLFNSRAAVINNLRLLGFDTAPQVGVGES